MEVRGLACPACGGTVPLTEGARITACSNCATTLLARGDLGLASYVVALRAAREQVLANLAQWWTGFDKARDLPAQARVTAAFPVFVPVWRVKGRVVGWVLGKEERQEGQRKVQVDVERRALTSCDVNRAACDLGEMGIRSVPLTAGALDPFDEEAVEKQGMIFRPLTPVTEVRQLAQERFLEQGRVSVTRLSQFKQAFLSVVGVSQSLVYYPLWVVHYEYRQRMYQATADGASGRLLYARAPGNDVYRVLSFVLGTGIGLFLFTTLLRGVDLPVLLSVLLPLGLLYWAYRALRYGAEVTLEQADS